jgi:hypothetical protein
VHNWGALSFSRRTLSVLPCLYDICSGMSQRVQAFLALIFCARRHNQRNTLYFEYYAWDERRNTSRSLCKVPVFVLNRFLTKIWSLSTNLSKILLCHTSRAFVERLLSRRLRPDRRKSALLQRFMCWPAEYRHAPHNDVSVNDEPHIRRWSLKIIIL